MKTTIFQVIKFLLIIPIVLLFAGGCATAHKEEPIGFKEYGDFLYKETIDSQFILSYKKKWLNCVYKGCPGALEGNFQLVASQICNSENRGISAKLFSNVLNLRNDITFKCFAGDEYKVLLYEGPRLNDVVKKQNPKGVPSCSFKCPAGQVVQGSCQSVSVKAGNQNCWRR